MSEQLLVVKHLSFRGGTLVKAAFFLGLLSIFFEVSLLANEKLCEVSSSFCVAAMMLLCRKRLNFLTFFFCACVGGAGGVLITDVDQQFSNTSIPLLLFFLF